MKLFMKPFTKTSLQAILSAHKKVISQKQQKQNDHCFPEEIGDKKADQYPQCDTKQSKSTYSFHLLLSGSAFLLYLMHLSRKSCMGIMIIFILKEDETPISSGGELQHFRLGGSQIPFREKASGGSQAGSIEKKQEKSFQIGMISVYGCPF